MKNRRLIILFGLLIMILTTVACATANPLQGTANSAGNVAGFWYGLWDGLTIWLSFIISWFDKGYGLYEVHNNGFWYNLGYLFGLGLLLGGSHAGSSRRRS